MRLASVRVVEVVCLWREDVQAARTTYPSKSISLEPPSEDHSKNSDNQRVKVPEPPHEEQPGTSSEMSGEQPKWKRVGVDGVGHERNTSDTNTTSVNCEAPSGPGGNDHVAESAGPSTGVGNEKTRDGKLARGEGGMPQNLAQARGGGDHATKGKWLVTMMVPGRKLWGSSPAMVSQYKRFRRSRQDPRIARDQLCLGVFVTKSEAVQAYDDALCREAVKQRSSVLRMAKKR